MLKQGVDIMAHAGGRPRAFSGPEQLQGLVDEYFDYCDSEKEIITDSKGQIKSIQKPYTITGLCVYLSITRETWSQYSKNPEFMPITAAAKVRVENYTEENTMLGKLNPIFSIFSLKNNFGWVDKMEIHNTNTDEQLTPDDINTTLQTIKRKQADKAETIDK